MTTWCPLHLGAHEPAVCPLSLLHEALLKYGEITIRLKDLGPDELGRTWFADSMIDLHRDMDPGEARATLQHELLHLLRGPADAADEAAEEEVVEQLAQVLLFPRGDGDDGEALRIKRRVWRLEETSPLSALPLTGTELAQPPTATVSMVDVIDPPTVPTIPGPRHATATEHDGGPRHALADEQIPASSSWVRQRAQRFARIKPPALPEPHE